MKSYIYKKIWNRYLPITLSVIVVVLAAVVYFTFRQQTPTAQAGWYASGGTWSYRKQITIDHNKVTGTTTNISNFPLLFSVTDSDLKFTGSGGKVASSTGGDILFTDSDGTTLLKFEIEKYASTTGETVAWIKIATLSPTADYVLYIYFGNASATDLSDKANVWDASFRGVYHLKDGTTLNVTDSTGANNGTNHSSTATTGQIDGGAAFDSASSQYIDLGSNASLQISTIITVEFWFKANSDYANTQEIVGLYETSLTASRWGAEFGRNDNQFTWFINGAGFVQVSSSTIADNNWRHVAIVRSGSSGSWTMTCYVNGVVDGIGTTGINPNNAGAPVSIGRIGDFNGQYFKGSLDEVRISSTTRTSAWVATEYKNQSSPSTFYAYGAANVQNRAATTPGEKAKGKIKVRGNVKFR